MLYDEKNIQIQPYSLLVEESSLDIKTKLLDLGIPEKLQNKEMKFW